MGSSLSKASAAAATAAFFSATEPNLTYRTTINNQGTGNRGKKFGTRIVRGVNVVKKMARIKTNQYTKTIGEYN